jgi:hypothetical protein
LHPLCAHCEYNATGISKAPVADAVPGAVLVELLTSERCADCPPADALLRQIEGKQTESGELIVVISEHGTYWNQLGWSDPFSSGSYTERETAYGQRFHLDGVAQMDLTALKIPQSLLRQLFKFDADYAEALFALDQRPRRFKLQAILRHASACLRANAPAAGEVPHHSSAACPRQNTCPQRGGL